MNEIKDKRKSYLLEVYKSFIGEFQTKVLNLIAKQTENRSRHARGPVHFCTFCYIDTPCFSTQYLTGRADNPQLCFAFVVTGPYLCFWKSKAVVKTGLVQTFLCCFFVVAFNFYWYSFGRHASTWKLVEIHNTWFSYGKRLPARMSATLCDVMSQNELSTQP